MKTIERKEREKKRSIIVFIDKSSGVRTPKNGKEEQNKKLVLNVCYLLLTGSKPNISTVSNNVFICT